MSPEEAIEKYKRLVYWIARSYAYRSPVDYEDLAQEGFLGLLIALRNFDSSKSTSSFLFLNIKGAMLNYLRDRGHLIKIPRGVQRDIRADKKPMVPSPISLDQKVQTEDEESANLYYYLGKEDIELERAEARVLIDSGLLTANLPYREKYVLKRYYWGKVSERIIAEELGCSQMQINRYKHSALEKLRDSIIYRNGPHQILQNGKSPKEMDRV